MERKFYWLLGGILENPQNSYYDGKFVFFWQVTEQLNAICSVLGAGLHNQRHRSRTLEFYFKKSIFSHFQKIFEKLGKIHRKGRVFFISRAKNPFCTLNWTFLVALHVSLMKNP